MSPSQRVVTWAELSEHTKLGDLWIAIDGMAYDVSDWTDAHPGGPIVLERCAGRDATEAFHAYHPDRVYGILGKFKVGRMETERRNPLPEATVKYNQLLQELKAEGLFETNYSFYFKLAAWLVSLYCLTWYLMVRGHWILGTFSVALFWQQVAFLGHDSGHNGITHVRKKDSIICLLSTAFVGIGMSYWKNSHNVHHTVVNSYDCDPDIQHMPVLAVGPEFFNSIYSKYYDHVLKYDIVAEVMIPYQHWTFLPVLCIAKWGLYIKSFAQLFAGRVHFSFILETLSFVVFFGWYIGMALCIPTWLGRVAFVFFSHCAFMVLHLQICISHFSRETFEGDQTEDDWMGIQMRGTMDWKCPTWMDWFHGGLQYQIEHHLFPRMPRHNLRKVVPRVEALCKELGLDYVSPGFFEAVNQTISSLRATAMEARKYRDAQRKLRAKAKN